MRNINDYNNESMGSGYGGAPVIAPVFATAPSAPYTAPAYGNNGGMFGGEGGLFGGLLAASLFGRGGFGNNNNGGCNDGGGHDNTAIFGATVLGKLGSIEGAVPLAASNIQNGLLEQTIGINNTINSSALAQLAATSNVKDTIQNTATAILLNDNNNAKEILGAICGLSSKIDQNLISQLQTDLLESRHSSRSRDLEVNVTQNVNQQQAQQQAQQQQQAQFGQLFTLFNHLAGDIQAVKQGQVIFNSGTMAASGTQAAANTKVA